MTKVAVCFSGMIRTGVHAHNNLYKFLEPYRGEFKFFLHTWKYQYDRPPRIDVNYSKTLEPVPHQLNQNEISFLTNTFDFVSIKIDTPEQIFGPLPAIGPNMLSWHQSIKLKQQYEITNNMCFDYVIKLRPDVIFRPGQTLWNILDKLDTMDFGLNHMYYHDILNIHEIDDVFYVSSSKAMDIAAQIVPDTFDQIDVNKRGYQYLIDHGIRPVNLEFDYWDPNPKHAILREQCLEYDPNTQFDHCAECNMRLHFPQNLATNHMSEDQIKRLNQKAGYPVE